MDRRVLRGARNVALRQLGLTPTMVRTIRDVALGGGAAAATEAAITAVKAVRAAKRSASSAPVRQSKRSRTAMTRATKRVARSGVVRATTSSRKKRRRTRTKKSLKSRISALEKTKPKLATLMYRNIDASVVTALANQAGYAVVSGITAALLESATTSVKYIDRNTTPAPDVINLNDQTYAHDMDFRKLYHKIEMRNNNEVTIHVDIYNFVVKDASDSNPLEIMQSQSGSYNVSSVETQIQLYPGHFPEVSNFFTLVKHDKAVLAPGDEFSMTWSRNRRIYDPKEKDSNADTYQKGDQFYLIRVRGGMSHDQTTTTSVGTANCQLDVISNRKVDLHYTAETPFKYFNLVNSLDTQAVGPEQAGPTVDPALQTV